MTTLAPPSPAQLTTLNDIKAFIASNKYSPTIMELSTIAGVCNNAMAQRVDALVKKGWLTRRRGLSRSLVPVSTENGSPLAAGNIAEPGLKRHPLYLTAEQLQLLSALLDSDHLVSTSKTEELRNLVSSASQAAGS